MKSKLYLLTTGALTLAAGHAAAQYAPPPPTQPFPGFLNQELRAKDPYWSNWDFGGQFRSRYEVRDNALVAPPFHDFKAVSAGVLNGHGNDNAFLANKLLLRAGYTDKWWNAMIVGRSSFVSGDNRGAAPNINAGSSPDSDGPAELHQANFTIGNHKEFPVSVKVGRQELSYGDERLVGAFAWNNIGRVFDGVKLRWQHEAFTAEAFSTRLVVPDDNTFNMPSDYEAFSGVHLTTKLVPKHTAELYFFSRNIGRSNPLQFGGAVPAAGGGSAFSPAPFNFSGRDVYTVGTRWKSNPGDFGNWDYSAEFNFQFGNYINDRPDAGVAQTVGVGTQAGSPANGSPTAPRLGHLAMAFSGMVGYTFADVVATPRVALEYNYASGDSNPTDGKHGTFDNLYPTNHKFYGYGDYMSWQNMHNLRLSLSAKPTPRWTVAVEGHLFWLADTSDVYYNVAGIPRAGIPGSLLTPNVGAGYRGVPGFSSSLGAEINLVSGYALNKATTLEAGYSHYFVGRYQEQSLQNVGGAKDADWFYVQAVFNF